MYKPLPRQEAYEAARLGLFIHWGPAAVCEDPKQRPGIIEPARFRPERFDPRCWARLARRAGMRYVVFTTKHADDFALFDSPGSGQANDVTRWGGPDYAAAIAEAFRAEGIRVHWYYAVKMNPGSEGYPWHKPAENDDFQRYVGEIMPNQIHELCANYGRVDGFWFDGVNEKYAKTYRIEDIFKLIRSLPNSAEAMLTLNDGGNRLILPDQDMVCWEFHANGLDVDYGKYMCFERDEPSSRRGLWFYRPGDALKSSGEICNSLIEHVRMGANYVLNIGPAPDGSIPGETERLLLEVGAWVQAHESDVFGPRPGRG